MKFFQELFYTEIMGAKPKTECERVNKMPIVKTENLTRVYGSGPTTVTALNNVSLAIEPGEFVAVMGPSGCGKSTLLNLIGGLDRPTSGGVMLDGQDIAALNDSTLTALRRRRIGFVFQFYNLIPVLDATENAALPLILDGQPHPRARQKAAEWLTRIGLKDRLSNRPDQLSGGEQQRVTVARALVAEPSLILADEPTGNLDTRASEEIASLLEQVASEWGRAVIMVTHDPKIAAHAGRVIFLKDGAVAGDIVMTGGGTEEVRQEMQKVGLL